MFSHTNQSRVCRVASRPLHSLARAAPPPAQSPQRTLGAKQARRQAPCGMRRLMTLASATRTSIRSPPAIRSNKKYRWYLSCSEQAAADGSMHRSHGWLSVRSGVVTLSFWAGARSVHHYNKHVQPK